MTQSPRDVALQLAVTAQYRILHAVIITLLSRAVCCARQRVTSASISEKKKILPGMILVCRYGRALSTV